MYVVVVVVNYLAFILGVSSLLVALGVDYRIARIVAGACEAVYIYSAMRWVVFRRGAAENGRAAKKDSRRGAAEEGHRARSAKKTARSGGRRQPARSGGRRHSRRGAAKKDAAGAERRKKDTAGAERRKN